MCIYKTHYLTIQTSDSRLICVIPSYAKIYLKGEYIYSRKSGAFKEEVLHCHNLES